MRREVQMADKHMNLGSPVIRGAQSERTGDDRGGRPERDGVRRRRVGWVMHPHCRWLVELQNQSGNRLSLAVTGV